MSLNPLSAAVPGSCPAPGEAVAGMIPAGSAGDVFPWQALPSSAMVWQFGKAHANVCMQLRSSESENPRARATHPTLPEDGETSPQGAEQQPPFSVVLTEAAS